LYIKPKSILLHLAFEVSTALWSHNEWQLWVRDGSIANLMQTCTSVYSDQQQGDPSLALVIRWPHNKHNIILEPAWGTIHNIKQQRIWNNNRWTQKKGVQGQTETEQGVGFSGCCSTSTSEMAAPSITARTGMNRCISPYKCNLDMSEAR